MTIMFATFASHATLACQELISHPPSESAQAGAGYLHVFGIHIPALAAVFLTSAIVWLVTEVIHRTSRR